MNVFPKKVADSQVRTSVEYCLVVYGSKRVLPQAIVPYACTHIACRARPDISVLVGQLYPFKRSLALSYNLLAVSRAIDFYLAVWSYVEMLGYMYKSRLANK